MLLVGVAGVAYIGYVTMNNKVAENELHGQPDNEDRHISGDDMKKKFQKRHSSDFDKEVTKKLHQWGNGLKKIFNDDPVATRMKATYHIGPLRAQIEPKGFGRLFKKIKLHHII